MRSLIAIPSTAPTTTSPCTPTSPPLSLSLSYQRHRSPNIKFPFYKEEFGLYMAPTTKNVYPEGFERPHISEMRQSRLLPLRLWASTAVHATRAAYGLATQGPRNEVHTRGAPGTAREARVQTNPAFLLERSTSLPGQTACVPNGSSHRGHGLLFSSATLLLSSRLELRGDKSLQSTWARLVP